MMPLVFLLIGACAGVLSGLFGIGGGILIVPALIWIAKMAPIEATGTSLGALLLPVGLLGAYEYHRNGHINIQASLLLAAGLAVGVYVGARWAHSINTFQLTRAFAVFLVLAAVRLWFSAK